MVWGSTWIPGWRRWRRWLVCVDRGLARGWFSLGGEPAWADVSSLREVQTAPKAPMPAGVVELWGQEGAGKSLRAWSMACDFAASGGLVGYVELHGVLDGVVSSRRSHPWAGSEPVGEHHGAEERREARRGQALRREPNTASEPSGASVPMVMLRPRDGDQAIAMIEAFLALPPPALIVVDHVDALIPARELSTSWGELAPWHQGRRDAWYLDALLRLDRAACASGSTVLIVRQGTEGMWEQGDGRFQGVQALARVARRRLEVTAGTKHRPLPEEGIS